MPKSRKTPPGYKAQLYLNWKSGLFTKYQLMEKYGKSLFKVNLIIEQMEEKHNEGANGKSNQTSK